MKYTKDDFTTWSIGIEFKRHFIHFKLFRVHIQKLFESGITKSQENKIFNDVHKEVKKKNKIVEKVVETRVLTFDDLKAGFVIWLVAVLASIIVFIFEKIVYKLTNKQLCCTAMKKSKKKKRKNKKKQKPKKTKMIHQMQSIDIQTLKIINLE